MLMFNIATQQGMLEGKTTYLTVASSIDSDTSFFLKKSTQKPGIS